jgi:hypothetical protein
VSAGSTPADRSDFRFTQPFRIGRAEDAEVCIQNQFVSRSHARVSFENGEWWVRDLGSANGLFVNGQRVEAAPIGRNLVLRLGVEGPFVSFEVEQPQAVPPASVGTETMIARYAEHYFGEPAAGKTIGEHTMMVRRAFQQVQGKQKRKYGRIMAALSILLLGVAAYAAYQHRQFSRQTALAQDLFYAMKSLDVDLAGLESLVRDSGSSQGAQQIQKYQSRRKEMEKTYDQFLSALRVYDPKMSEQDRLVLRVARIFGECELAMPQGFLQEVRNYIGKWQSTGRLARAVRLAGEKGYTVRITSELLAENLPPQFFYLALQESDFDPHISGPPTKKGIAKGMWQFIPETGAKYGLRIGPLAEFRRPDPADDRHNWEKATKAATRYLKDIYSTDAQASGLLVMASYNWGEGRVVRRIQSMPANPRERNFWRLLTNHREELPTETYDYVFHIVSAAVIGENPRLFGFDFDNPLAHLEAR